MQLHENKIVEKRFEYSHLYFQERNIEIISENLCWRLYDNIKTRNFYVFYEEWEKILKEWNRSIEQFTW